MTRTFRVTLDIPGDGQLPVQSAQVQATSTPSSNGVGVFSPFEGDAPVVELKVKKGDAVSEGQILAAVEAMKANHPVKAPVAGSIQEVLVEIGDDVGAGKPIMTILQN